MKLCPAIAIKLNENGILFGGSSKRLAVFISRRPISRLNLGTKLSQGKANQRVHLRRKLLHESLQFEELVEQWPQTSHTRGPKKYGKGCRKSLSALLMPQKGNVFLMVVRLVVAMGLLLGIPRIDALNRASM